LTHQPAIVLVTAFGRDEVREEAERLHLDGFLVKPVTRTMMVDTLVNLFGDSRPAGADTKPAADEGAGRLRGARILLVEDNEINQQIAVELLGGAGAAVRVVGNGREAVHMLSEGPDPAPIDVVLMDLQMPEMDGFQATAELRADRRFTSLPIIAMTAHATIEERQRCLAAGMNDHVAKPIDPAVLFGHRACCHAAGGVPARGSGGSEGARGRAAQAAARVRSRRGRCPRGQSRRYWGPSWAEMTLWHSSDTSRAMRSPRRTQCSIARRASTPSDERMLERQAALQVGLAASHRFRDPS
jgi:CheY-like chemotaxis protein